MDKIVVVLGQTASGKSDLAVMIAKDFNGEVISADSRQVYKGLDIGTGKITRKEMCGVPHFLLDVASPRTAFTAAKFRAMGRKVIQTVLKKNKLPIICGGSGFYIDNLIYDQSLPDVPPDPELRNRLENLSAAELFSELEDKDPGRATDIDRHNKRRLIRALEIIHATGGPVGKFERKQRYQTLKIGIIWPKDKLRERIQSRLFTRMKSGMAREAKMLHAHGVSYKRMEALGLEYRYLAKYLKGELDKEEMLRQLEREIWNFAKRQATWFKRDKDIVWIKNYSQALKATKKFLRQN